MNVGSDVSSKAIDTGASDIAKESSDNKSQG